MSKKRKTAQQGKHGFFEKNTQFVLIVLLSLSVIAIYAKTSGFDFVLIDDNTLIYERPLVTNPEIPYSECFNAMLGGVHYKPLVFLSWKLQYNLWGDSPSHFHTINWILHLLNTLILFLVLKIIFSKIYADQRKVLLSAFFATLFFTINPLRIESVAWATERKDVLFGFFFLISWWAYLKYLTRNNYFYLFLGVIAYFLSGLSKSMGITLIAVVVLSDLWFVRKINLKLILEKLPFLIVTLVLSNLYGLFDIGGASTGEASSLSIPEIEEIANQTTAATEFFSGTHPILERIATTSTKFMFWLLHSFIPIKLSVHYPHTEIYNSLGTLMFLPPFVVVGLFVGAWLIRKRNMSYLGGLLFFLVTLSPSLALNQTGQAIFLSDRYTYIPSIGLFVILVAFINQLSSKKVSSSILAVFIIFFASVSFGAVNYWKNTRTLTEQVLKVNTNSGLAHLNLGKYYLEEGNKNKAIEIYTQGISRAPGYYKLYSNRGKIFFDNGETDMAIQDFDKCLSLKPDYVIALTNRGSAYGRKQQYDKALEDFNAALELRPSDTNALSNRGLLYMFTREYEKAIEDYSKYLEREPGDADIINALGLSYQNLQRYDEAINEYDRAIRINPSSGAFFYNRSLAYNSLGDKQKALQDALQAQTLGANVNASYLRRLQSQ